MSNCTSYKRPYSLTHWVVYCKLCVWVCGWKNFDNKSLSGAGVLIFGTFFSGAPSTVLMCVCSDVMCVSWLTRPVCTANAWISLSGLLATDSFTATLTSSIWWLVTTVRSRCMTSHRWCQRHMKMHNGDCKQYRPIARLFQMGVSLRLSINPSSGYVSSPSASPAASKFYAFWAWKLHLLVTFVQGVSIAACYVDALS